MPGAGARLAGWVHPVVSRRRIAEWRSLAQSGLAGSRTGTVIAG